MDGATMRRARGRGVSRRGFLKMGGLAGAAVLGGGLVAGCGGGESSGGAVEITLGFIPDEAGGLQTLLDRFNKENKGEIQVKWRQMPASSAEFFEQMQAELQSGRSTMDVIAGDVVWPAQFAANDYILDLSDRFTAKMQQDYLEGPVQAVQYEGKAYGVPWFTDAGMFYYRTDLLEKSGFSEPPKTWDEMKRMSEKVRADSGTKYGFVFQGSSYEGGVVDGLEYINSHGGSVLAEDDPSRVVIGSPESTAGLQMERSMVADGVAPQSVAQYTEQESQGTFLRGDAVFCRNWPYMYALAADPEQSKIKQDQISVAPLPAGPGRNGRSVSGLGGWSFLINAAMDEETQDAAWKFIEFASAPEQQKFRAIEGGFLPTLKALYDDQDVLDAVPVIKLAPEVLSRTVPRPVSPYYSDMSLEMAAQFNDSLNGETTPAKAVKTLQEELQNIAEQTS